MPRYKKADFEAAIPGSGGVMSTIAKRVGCNWHTANTHIMRSPDLKAAWEAERYQRNDVARSVYLSNIDSLYQLQTIARQNAQYWRDQMNIPGITPEAYAHAQTQCVHWLHESIMDTGDLKWWLNKMDSDFKDQLDLNISADQPLLQVTAIDYRSAIAPLAPGSVGDSDPSGAVQSAGNGQKVGENGIGRRN